MRAVVVEEFGGPEAVRTIEVPVPEPGPGEVLVRVAGASVNFADVIVRSGLNVQYGATAARPRFGLGADLAATVERVGDDVTAFAPGDHVIGTQERIDVPLGPQAEFAVLESWALAPLPDSVDLVSAATIGLNGTTADEALDVLDLAPGEWLLVSGAAGAVGLYAVELAQLRGLRVIAQAKDADEDLLRQAGAEHFMPRREDLVPTVRRLVPGGVHGAIDAANLAAGTADAVRHGGSFVSLLNSAPQARRGITMTNLAWWTDAERLAKLTALASTGRISLRVARTFSFDEAAEAHRVLEAGGLRGRIVLVP